MGDPERQEMVLSVVVVAVQVAVQQALGHQQQLVRAQAVLQVGEEQAVMVDLPLVADQVQMQRLVLVAAVAALIEPEAEAYQAEMEPTDKSLLVGHALYIV
jgi:hypothetical protein